MKKALLIGINYLGTKHSLPGCVNDVRTIDNVLDKYFNFTNKLLLNDAASANNIIENIKWLVDADISYLHFSGHGSNSSIWPVDLNVGHKDISSCFESANNLTMFLDCCNTNRAYSSTLAINDVNGCVISSCSAGQKSLDTWMHGGFMGLATYFLVNNLRDNNWDLDYIRLVAMMNRDFKKFNHKQRATLTGNDLGKSKFLK